jgi:hypothetical protein
MGTATRSALKPLAWTGGILLAIYLVAGVYLAGQHESLAPPPNSPVVFTGGKALGQKLTGRSWTADFDRIVSNADQTVLHLDGVRHAVIFKDGKPYLRVRAEHMTVNTLTHDFVATGPIHIEMADSGPKRTFETDQASWTDASQVLNLPHQSEVGTGAELPLLVGSIRVDVKSGDIELHRVGGAVNFK